VEDHEPSRRAMMRLLKQSGFDVRSARDYEQAMKLANDGPFDLLITDLLLPTHSGWELLETLSAKKRVRAIAVSAYSSTDEIARSTSAGFIAHLIKPIDLNKLRLAIDEAMNA
jgi:DNA-binding NtrC family response regulator